MVHLVLTMLVISATGHHWWLDGIVALALLWVSLQLDTVGRRAVRATRAALVAGNEAPGDRDRVVEPVDGLQPAFVHREDG
jgi:hypothetical protein